MFGLGITELMIIVLILLIYTALPALLFWKIFLKAHMPGWSSIIPFYNIYCLVKISGRPMWCILFIFAPIFNILIFYTIALGVSLNFRKSWLFALGLTFLPIFFYPILGFNNDKYYQLSAYTNQRRTRKQIGLKAFFLRLLYLADIILVVAIAGSIIYFYICYSKEPDAIWGPVGALCFYLVYCLIIWLISPLLNVIEAPYSVIMKDIFTFKKLNLQENIQN